jgi:DNA polymerase-3 subunit epsilon
MILAIDTETTGLFDQDAPVDARHQPKLVRVAAILFNGEGEKRKEHALIDVKIKPDGWIIPPEATKVHGITDHQANATGIPLTLAVKTITNLAKCALKVIAYNLEYDIQIMQAAIAQCGGDPKEFPRPSMERFCVMKPMTPICKFLHRDPKHEEDYRWPSLGEAHAHVFGVSHLAHDALSDVRATIKLHDYLKEEGLA